MINTVDDILKLAYFEYPTEKFIPGIECVYFIFSAMELIYIGCTRNLENRISRHHVLKSGNFGNIRIHYTESYHSVARLLEVERKLIKELDPRLNRQKFKLFTETPPNPKMVYIQDINLLTYNALRSKSGFFNWCLEQSELVKKFHERTKPPQKFIR